MLRCSFNIKELLWQKKTADTWVSADAQVYCGIKAPDTVDIKELKRRVGASGLAAM